jgi:hypothetical protein
LEWEEENCKEEVGRWEWREVKSNVVTATESAERRVAEIQSSVE